MPSKALEVLSIHELIEAILLELPHLDLLITAPLINRTFNHIVDTSPAIQQKLFFAPKTPKALKGSDSEKKEAYAALAKGNGNWEFNPLLCKAFPPWFPTERALPLLLNCATVVDMKKLPWNKNAKSIAAFSRGDASWRYMLVTQPPILDFQVIRKRVSPDGGDEHEENGAIRLKNGVRMGNLYDLAERWIIDKSPLCSFELDWQMLPPVTNISEKPLAAWKVTVYLEWIASTSYEEGVGYRGLIDLGGKKKNRDDEAYRPDDDGDWESEDVWVFHSECEDDIENYIDFVDTDEWIRGKTDFLAFEAMMQRHADINAFLLTQDLVHWRLLQKYPIMSKLE